MEKFLENLVKAEKTLKTADHMMHVTFPLIKDKRLLLKILQETKNAVTNCISSILQYEYMFKRINLYRDPKENFKTFVQKCAPRYNIQENELMMIFELFDFVKKHQESPFEFIKDEKLVILSNGMRPKTLTIDKTKEFLIVAKDILRKVQQGLNHNF